MHINSDGVYVLGWGDDFVTVFPLDHTGNLRWAKRINQRGLAEDTYVDGSIYVVGSSEGKSFLVSFDPANDRAQGILLSGCWLKAVTVLDESVYCAGSTRDQNITAHLVNLTTSDMDAEVVNFNWSLNSCKLTLSDVKGSFTDFTVGSGENSDILIVRADKLNRSG